MNLPNDRIQVGVQQYECIQFEQLLDDCLDDRNSISELVQNAHLQYCDDCQNLFEVYRQFDGGGAVLNGGSRVAGQSAKLRLSGQKRANYWSGIGTAVLTTSAAVLMLFLLASPTQQSDSDDAAQNFDSPNHPYFICSWLGGS